MKLRKMMLTLVAVLAASVTFAGNTSDLRVFITQFFSGITMMASYAEDEDAPEVVQLMDTAKALKAGLLQYDTELTAGELSEQGKIIDNAFAQIPTILNKIGTSSSEVMPELIPVIQQLTTAIIKNQTKVPASKVDQETALALMLFFAEGKAEQEGVLLGRASRVLQQEIQGALEGLMTE